MRKRLLLLSGWAVLVIGIMLLGMATSTASGKTITVDDSGRGDYRRIQEGVNAADPGDTVRVWAGTYDEDVLVEKTINLIGNGTGSTDFCRVNGNEEVFRITSDWTNISGFKIFNGEVGVHLSNVENVNISDVYCHSSTSYSIGIEISSSANCTVTQSECSFNKDDGIKISSSDYITVTDSTCRANSDHGVNIYSSDYCTIERTLTRSNNDHGFYLFNSQYNTLDDCNASGNHLNGIHIYNADHNSVVNTRSSGNDNGIHLDRADHTTITSCNISGNNYGQGILIEESDYNEITGCEVSNNRYRGGMYFEYSRRNSIIDTVCSNNEGSAILFFESSSNKVINITSRDNERDAVNIGQNSQNITVWDTTMIGCGFHLWGNFDAWDGQHIAENNTVNGKPLRFIKHESSREITEEAGQIILFDCTGIIISDREINSGSVGVMVGYSSNITIANVTASNHTLSGFEIVYSDHCTLENVTSGGCQFAGVDLDRSDYNVIKDSTFSYNQDGVYLWYAEYNTLERLTCFGNSRSGINFESNANYMTVTDSTCRDNDQYGIRFFTGRDSTIEHSDIMRNPVGIYVRSYTNAQVHNCSIENNTDFGIQAEREANATGNWWGHDTGPYHEETNPRGKGDNVTDLVTFDPWTGKENIMRFVDDDADPGGDGSRERPYQKIQDALDSSVDGGIVIVASGTYDEEPTVDITILMTGAGPDTTEIRGDGNGNVMTINAKNVTVTGFKVTGSGSWPDSGIAVKGDHATIHNNTLEGNGYGIYLSQVQFAMIVNNTCTNNHYGISIDSFATKNIVLLNTCSGNSENGIFLSQSDGNDVRENTCAENTNGILLSQSDENDIHKNDCSLNRDGIAVSSSDGNSLMYNLITNNFRDGLRSSLASTNTEVRYNQFSGNQEHAVHSVSADSAVTAQRNWWGHASGPFHDQSNPSGVGDAVSDDVDFDPWLHKPPFEDYILPVGTIIGVTPSKAVENEDVVFSGSGIVYRDVSRYVWSSSIDGEFYNGTESEVTNSSLTPGPHTITYRIADDYGVWSVPRTESLTINGIPTARILAIFPAPFTEGDIVSFRGAGMDDHDVTHYAWNSSIDGPLYVGTSNQFDSPFQLSNGTHIIYLSVRDDEGVWSELAFKDLFINGKPRVHTISVLPEVPLSSDTLGFTNDSRDDGTIMDWSWRVENAITHEEVHSGPIPPSSLPVGDYDIFLKVQDELDAWSEEGMLSFQVIDPPIAVISSILPNPALFNETVEFTGNGTGSSEIDRFLWTSSIDGELSNDTGPTLLIDDLSHGTHIISLRVMNVYGYWSEPVLFTLLVHTEPRAAITSITPEPGIQDAPVTFLGNGSDDGAIMNYSWRSSLDGELYHGPNASVILEVLSPGDHIIYLRVQDDHDVWSLEVNTTFTIDPPSVPDTIPPTLQISSPENGTIVKGELTISGEATDDRQVTRIDYRIPGSMDWTPIVTSTSWSFTMNTSVLSDGEHTLEIRCYDGIQYSDIRSVSINAQNEQDEPVDDDGSDGFDPFDKIGPLPFVAYVGIIAAIVIIGIVLSFGRKGKEEDPQAPSTASGPVPPPPQSPISPSHQYAPPTPSTPVPSQPSPQFGQQVPPFPEVSLPPSQYGQQVPSPPIVTQPSDRIDQPSSQNWNCSGCGSIVEGTYSFCLNCGTKRSQ